MFLPRRNTFWKILIHIGYIRQMLVKAFIRIMIQIFTTKHPYIFFIIDILKLFQVNTFIKIKTTNSNTKTKICKKYAEKENVMYEKIDQYDYLNFITNL